MKKRKMVFGTLAVALAFGLVLAGCDSAALAGLMAAPANQQAADGFKAAHAAALALTEDSVSVAHKAAVTAALTAYNGLTAAVQALLPSDTGSKLQALLNKIGALEAGGTVNPADVAAASAFTGGHSAALALRADTVSVADKPAVEAALAAYNGLSAGAQALLTSEKARLDVLLAKIADLETAGSAGAADLAAAAAYRTAYAGALALTADSVSVANKDAVQAALTAYNGLSAAVKALLTSEKALLDGLATKIGQLEAEAADAAANQQAADGFKATHAAALAKTVDSVSVTDKAAVTAALTAYNGLSAAVKALLPADTGSKLQALLEKIGQLEAAAAEAAANQQAADAFTSAHAAALVKTVDNVSVANKAAVEAALTAYNGLSAGAQALLTSEKAQLDVLLAKIADLEEAGNASAADLAAAAAYRTGQAAAALALTVDSVSVTNKAAVQAALAAYDGLSDAVKALLTSEKTKLDGLLDKIGQLETAAANQQAATVFAGAHGAALAKTVGTVSVTDKAAVTAALTAYNGLSDAVKALLTSEKTKLDGLLDKIGQLEAVVAVSELNLTSLLTAPVKGAAPATAINTTQYTGTVEWYTNTGSAHSGNFAAATVYRALVTLSAQSGYTFTGVAANSFTHMGASAVANGVNSGTVTITFPATADAVVNALDLTGLVIAPVKGALPSAMPINETQYTGSIAWYTGAGSPHSGAFADSTVYKAVVALSVQSGYTFAGVLQNSFTYAGATSVTNAANSGTVTITFPATAHETGGVGVYFTGLPQDETIGLTGSTATLSWTANTAMTVTVGGSFSAYTWYVDGALLSLQSGNSVTLTARNYSLGGHNISVRVTTGGASYSKTAYFTITQ